jgi:hypothetical protein
MTRFFYIAFFILSFCLLEAFSPPQRLSRYMNRPSLLRETSCVINARLKSQPQAPLGDPERDKLIGLPWYVVIDRTDVKAFQRPADTNSMAISLRYLDVYIVGEEKGAYLHLFKDPNLDHGQSRFSGNAMDYGWIHRDHALLWDQAQQSCQLPKGYLRKAIPRMSLSASGQATNLLAFSHPEQELGELIPSDAFFYIYKEDSLSWLLGKTPKCYNLKANARKDIIGWVSKSNWHIWEKPLALEPNFREEAVMERREKGKACAFATREEALAYQQGAEEGNVLWQDTSLTRHSGDWFRLPGFVLKPWGKASEPYKVLLPHGLAGGRQAFVPLQREGHEFPLFTRVLLLDREQVFELLDDMKDFLGTGSDQDRRERFYQTWREKLEAKQGDGAGNMPSPDSLYIGQINEMVFGLTSVAQPLAEVQLAYIRDTGMVSPVTLATYEAQLNRKYSELRRIVQKRGYEMALEINESLHYWLEENLFP